MREFEERFGAGARTDLETTFRCSDGLCKLATRFVLGNPAQIEKKVRTVHGVDGPAVWIDFGGAAAPPSLDEALNRIAADVAPTERRPNVLLLGRYRHLKPDMRRLARKHPALDLSYRTVHAAKGLEAEYVVVLGVCAGRYGFPTEATDDPLLDLVLTAPEEHPNAEERRLFYVALTRAKRRACLLEEGGPRSPFVEELLQAGDGIQTFGSPNATDVNCPECTKGHLVQRATRAAAGSTAAPTTPIANTRSPRARSAGRDSRCATEKPQYAASADTAFRAARSATAGYSRRRGSTGRSWAVRTGPPAYSRKRTSSAERRIHRSEPPDRLRPRQVLHAPDLLDHRRGLPPGHRQQRHVVPLPDHRFEIRPHVRPVVIVHWYGPGYSIFSARANADDRVKQHSTPLVSRIRPPLVSPLRSRRRPSYRPFFPRFPCAPVPIPRHLRKTKSDPKKTFRLSAPARSLWFHLAAGGSLLVKLSSGKGKTTARRTNATRRGPLAPGPRAGHGTRPQGGIQMEIRSTTDREIRRSRRS